MRDKITIIKGKVSILRRVNLLFFIIVLLFTGLLLRLGQMQLLQKDFYLEKLKSSSVYTITTSNPRGKIYDSQGVVLADNEIKTVLTFTRDNKMTAGDIKATAQHLATYVSLPEATVSDRAKKDYYLADTTVYQEVVKALPDSQKYDDYGNSLTESEIYQHAVDSVSDDKIAYSDDELKIISIFNQMNAISNFTSVNLEITDIPEDFQTTLSEHQSELEGITLGQSWDRILTDSSLSDLIGTISTEKTGLPEESAQAYLKKGYSLNDRVGLSYIEKEYESDLQGEHTVRSIEVDRQGDVVSNQVTTEGSTGHDLKLTVDLNFQNTVDSILSTYYQSEIATGNAVYSDGMYAVALEPSTGKILALSGISHDMGSSSFEYNILGTINNTFTPGSVVKGATLTAGWENNVLSGDEVLYDQQIANIRSWFTSGLTPITASQALEYSSNTYMVQVALRLMGQTYETGDALVLKNYKDAMKKLRAAYAEYGMGTSTGVDLPEATGFLPDTFNSGEVLNESFGQYDSYTPLQLAQYAATVANSGKRISLHIVEGIYSETDTNGLGDLIKEISGQELNQVSLSDEDMDIIQTGFYNVVNSNSAYATGTSLRSYVTTISGKTGTAETSVQDSAGNVISTVNLNVIAYDADSSIAVAVMYPHAADDSSKVTQLVAKSIIESYVMSGLGNR